MTRLITGSMAVIRRSLATVTEQAPPALANEIISAEPTLTTQNSINNKPRFAEKILGLTESSLQLDGPHFRIGGDKRYFPKARVILLRPNAKHTPYQAKFIVPKSFNKMDLRDYLYHVYGLRALNITTQLMPGAFVRGSLARYRQGQIKKMTIDMEDPFIWPAVETGNKESLAENQYGNEHMKYSHEISTRVGSDNFKPFKAFEGIYRYDAKYVKHSVENFIPKFLGRRLKNEKKSAESKYKKQDDVKLMESLLQKKQQSL